MNEHGEQIFFLTGGEVEDQIQFGYLRCRNIFAIFFILTQRNYWPVCNAAAGRTQN